MVDLERRALVVAAVATLPLSTAAAQAPAVVTPTSVARRPLALQTDTMDIVLVRSGARRSGGRFAVGLTRHEVDGREIYLAVATDMSPTGARTFDTLAVDAATLAPLWHRSHAATDSAAVEYRDGRATGYAHHENQPRRRRETATGR